MKEHIFSAYDYMNHTASCGEIKLLPRPTQEMLAKMTNMEQPDVSRCLKDSEGKIFKMLWEKSQSLDGIHELAKILSKWNYKKLSTQCRCDCANVASLSNILLALEMSVFTGVVIP
jgi:hypothetical protein